MSRAVTTPLGRFRYLPTRDGQAWFMECDACGGFEKLAPEQLRGEVSVNHAATGCPSGYHETHNYSTSIAVALGEQHPQQEDR